MPSDPVPTNDDLWALVRQQAERIEQQSEQAAQQAEQAAQQAKRIAALEARQPAHGWPLFWARFRAGAVVSRRALSKVLVVAAVLVWALGPGIAEASGVPNSWACSTGDASSGCSSTALVPMPIARWELAAATGTDGRIYTIGGEGSSSYLSTVEAYDPGTNTWTCSTGVTVTGCASSTLAPMPTGRENLAAATGSDGRIYAIGGFDTGDLTIVEAYDPGTNTWTCSTGDASALCSSTALAPMPTARSAFAAATGSDGRIYAIGGNDGNPLATVEAYDPGTNTWACSTGDTTTGCASSTLAPMPTARVTLVAATVPDGTIYVAGGYNGSSIVGTVEAYTGISSSVRGLGLSDPGGSFGSVSGAALHLDPSANCPLTSGGSPGDICVNTHGIVYVCAFKTSGPCTWHPLAFSDGGPTVVHVASFHVVRKAQSLHFSWRVANAHGVAGFDVYAGAHRLNGRLIPVHTARTYQFSVHPAITGSTTLHVILTDGEQSTIRSG